MELGICAAESCDQRQLALIAYRNRVEANAIIAEGDDADAARAINARCVICSLLVKRRGKSIVQESMLCVYHGIAGSLEPHPVIDDRHGVVDLATNLGACDDDAS